ncbi:hypothetical protein PIROE2DRAFT_3747, partial [Piromyces sp. E2]
MIKIVFKKFTIHTGYLHCFNLKLSKSTIRQFTVHKKGTGENILEAGQYTYKNGDKVKTSFSIQLRSPRVVAIDTTRSKDNEQEYTFSIIINNSAFNVIPPPQSTQSNDGNDTGSANNNNTKAKKIKSNKNQEVHVLRCDTHEILEDWLNIINLKLKDMPVEVQP